MHPIAFSTTVRLIVWIAKECIFLNLAKSKLIKMITNPPFPYDVTIPVNFNNAIIQQTLVGNTMII